MRLREGSGARGAAPTGGVLAATAAAQRRVAPFMAAALAALLLGMWAGLARIGWQLPSADGALMLRHGGLMVVGFVGTVIAVERAVAVRSLPAFAAPALSAAAGLALIVAAPAAVAPALAAAAGVAYSLNIAILLWRYRQPPFAVLLAGGLALAAAGVVWWHGGGIPRVVPWWMAFLVLTIAAERLEILRFQRFTAASTLAGAAALVLLAAGPLVTIVDLAVGTRLLGAGIVVGVAWLARRDVARHTVRTDGLARFAAVGILTAYAWLLVTGALLVAWGLIGSELRYDAVIHAFFIGFVFGAIIAHEPIIAPAVTGLRFAYSPVLYAPLMLLDGGLVVRVWADVAGGWELRRWAGLVQVIAILLLLALTAASNRVGETRGAPRSGRRPRAPVGALEGPDAHRRSRDRTFVACGAASPRHDRIAAQRGIRRPDGVRAGPRAEDTPACVCESSSLPSQRRSSWRAPVVPPRRRSHRRPRLSVRTAPRSTTRRSRCRRCDSRTRRASRSTWHRSAARSWRSRSATRTARTSARSRSAR